MLGRGIADKMASVMASFAWYAIWTCGIGAILLVPLTNAAEVPSALENFLRTAARFSDDDVEHASEGRAVAKLLHSEEKRELAVIGVVQAAITREFYLKKFRDITNFKRSYAVPQIGKFSDPPVMSDLDGLELPAGDLKDLKKCRPGECKLRLSDEYILRFRDEIGAEAPDYPEQATRFFREMLLDYMKVYLSGGNAVLAEYHDHEKPAPILRDLDEILEESPYILQYTPELFRYLKEFPRNPPKAVEDFVYWSREEFGLKPVVSVTHVTIYQGVGEDQPAVLIASKQIYASHYFDASLGLTALVEGGVDGSELQYLIYLNRTRAHGLGGTFSGVKRSLVGGRLRKSIEKTLFYTKARLEAIYRAEASQLVTK
jgi:hypothetical protein